MVSPPMVGDSTGHVRHGPIRTVGTVRSTGDPTNPAAALEDAHGRRSDTLSPHGAETSSPAPARSTTSAAARFSPMPVTWAARTESHGGKTSPEELLAAAHASCFSMALPSRLAGPGRPPEKLEVKAAVTFDKGEAGWSIASSALTVRGTVPGSDGRELRRRPKPPRTAAPSRRPSRATSPCRSRRPLEPTPIIRLDRAAADVPSEGATGETARPIFEGRGVIELSARPPNGPSGPRVHLRGDDRRHRARRESPRATEQIGYARAAALDPRRSRGDLGGARILRRHRPPARRRADDADDLSLAMRHAWPIIVAARAGDRRDAPRLGWSLAATSSPSSCPTLISILILGALPVSRRAERPT